MIYIEKLSNEEKKAIEELRQRMKTDFTKDVFEDIFLYRFLKARDFDVDKAEIMLRKHISWRKHFQVDTILEEFTPKPFFEKFPKLSDLGLDKNGNVIKYIPMGNLDAKDIMKCVTLNEYMKHWTWHFEEISQKLRKLSDEKKKKVVPQVILIINLDKLTFANATSRTSMEVCVRFMRLAQDNYPENLNAVYIINTPGYYMFIYSILKTMMSSSMMKKMHVYSNDGWQVKLLETIDADVLPMFLGGNRTDPDGNPLCITFMTHGGKIPEKYYLPEKERDFRNRSLVRRITVPSKQKKEISVHAEKICSRIFWEFFIKSKDIGFGLLYKVSESDSIEILPVERYNTVDGVEKGSYKIQSTGNYIIVFDNSYSWMNSKEIDYCITVT